MFEADTLPNLSVQAPPEYFLWRLRRVLQLRKNHEGQLNDDGLRFLEKTAFADYCTLRDLGCEAQARTALEAVVPQYLSQERR